MTTSQICSASKRHGFVPFEQQVSSMLVSFTAFSSMGMARSKGFPPKKHLVVKGKVKRNCDFAMDLDGIISLNQIQIREHSNEAWTNH